MRLPTTFWWRHNIFWFEFYPVTFLRRDEIWTGVFTRCRMMTYRVAWLVLIVVATGSCYWWCDVTRPMMVYVVVAVLRGVVSAGGRWRVLREFGKELLFRWMMVLVVLLLFKITPFLPRCFMGLLPIEWFQEMIELLVSLTESCVVNLNQIAHSRYPDSMSDFS